MSSVVLQPELFRAGGAPLSVGIVGGGVAGLATAYAASSPVVFIAGQILRHGIGKGLGLLHEVDDQRHVLQFALGVGEADVDIFHSLVLDQLQGVLDLAHR